MIFAKNSFIILRKALKVLFMSEMLNFFYLFMMFRMSFLITHENDFIACLYLKSFMLFKSTCDFFRKKLQHSMSVFFFVVRAACHLELSLNSIVVLEQQHCLTLFICSYRNETINDSDSR